MAGSFLDIAIPFGIFAFMAFLLFRSFGPEIQSLFEWIKGQNEPTTEKIDPMYGGTINYAK